MSSNYPAGFAGFQMHMEAAAEAAGGDALAWMAAEHVFAAAIESVMRKAERREERDLFHFRRPHLGQWLRARDPDWQAAAEIADQHFYFDESDAPALAEGEHYRTIYGRDSVIRVTRKAGIVLAKRHGTMLSLTDPGYAWAQRNGHTFRSHHRHYRTAAAAILALAKLAQNELKSEGRDDAKES